MELKYLWIKEYKNLKEIGFNIRHSGTENFDFVDGNITISETKSNQPKAFFGDNFNGVSSIVGANGSGKTNLTEFINYNLTHVTNGGLSTWIKSEGFLIIDKWIFVQQDIEISNEKELKLKGYTINKFENAPLDKGQTEIAWHKMAKNKYIYYSPLFDQRMIHVHDNLINISTTYLVYNDYYNSRKSHVDYRGNRKTKYITTQLDAHYRMELTRQAELVLFNDSISDYVDFTPNRIQVGLDHESENRMLGWEWKSEKLEGDGKDNQAIILNKLNRTLDELEMYQLNQYKDYFIRKLERSSTKIYIIPNEIKKTTFIRLFFLKMFRVLTNSEKIIFPEDYYRRFIYDEETKSFDGLDLDEKLKSIKIDLKLLTDNAIWKEIEVQYNEDNYSFDDAESLRQEINLNNLYRNIILDLNIENSKKLLLKIINESTNILNGISILHYELLGQYSSGEQLLLSFYSRFLYAKNEILEQEKEQFGISGEAIIIFIDEGETSLHPEWQRLYFDKIRSYLSSLFKDYKIQLILISHSPFVLSDIPEENIIFLTKDSNGNTSQVKIDSDKTLGANIHDLLSNSFFMQSTIGKFAEEKVKKIIDFYYRLNQSNTSESLLILKEEYSGVQNEFHYVINNIGDEVISNILFNHIEYIERELFGDDYIDSRINELEKELKRLKKRKK